MPNSDFYPELHRGDPVEWAPNADAPDPQWRFGHVAILKNDSCDIEMTGPGGAREYRHDCFFAADPRCRERGAWSQPDRGVFRLTNGTRQTREMLGRRFPNIEEKVARMEKVLEGMAMKRDSLEPRIAMLEESVKRLEKQLAVPPQKRPGRKRSTAGSTVGA